MPAFLPLVLDYRWRVFKFRKNFSLWSSWWRRRSRLKNYVKVLPPRNCRCPRRRCTSDLTRPLQNQREKQWILQFAAKAQSRTLNHEKSMKKNWVLLPRLYGILNASQIIIAMPDPRLWMSIVQMKWLNAFSAPRRSKGVKESIMRNFYALKD